MFRSISKYAWLSFVPFIALALTTTGLIATGIISPLYLIGTFIMWCMVSGLGVAVGYHRVFAHKTHDLPVWKQNILLFFAALSGQGSSITWTAIHRGYHHTGADTVRDLHTPTKGLWYAFFGWTLQITEEANIINMKHAIDLLRKPNHIWFHHHQMTILWLTPLLVALVDWKLALACCALPTGLSLLQDNCVNVFGHVKALIGYRNFETNDNSHNNLILGYLGWGQGLHNNHHARPASYDFGSGVSGKWWEIDPCRLFLPFLE